MIIITVRETIYRISVYGLDSTDSGYNSMADICEHGNEHLGRIRDEKLLDQLSNYQLRNKNSAP
jgi:hypothetical protein